MPAEMRGRCRQGMSGGERASTRNDASRGNYKAEQSSRYRRCEYGDVSQTWILEVTKKGRLTLGTSPSALYAEDIIYRTPCCGIKVDVGERQKEAK